MTQIFLNTNLKFIVADLSLTQKGKLLNAILQIEQDKSDMIVAGIYNYIAALQEEFLAKKQHMKEIGAKGLAARLKKKSGAENAAHTPCITSDNSLQRKETKENNKYNYNNNFLFGDFKQEKVKEEGEPKEPILFAETDKKVLKKKGGKPKFTPPTVAEAEAFMKAENLLVDAEVFVNFYEARGWCVGRTAIQNWQATARLWHRRKLQDKQKELPDEEGYWHQLAEKMQTQKIEVTEEKTDE